MKSSDQQTQENNPDAGLIKRILIDTSRRYRAEVHPARGLTYLVPLVGTFKVISDEINKLFEDKSDRTSRAATYCELEVLVQSLDPAEKADQAKLIILMDVILQKGGRILQACLVEEMAAAIQSNEVTPAALRTAVEMIYGQGSYQASKDRINSDVVMQIVREASANSSACRKLRCEPSLREKTFQLYVEFMNGGFTPDFFYRRIFSLNIKYAELKQALERGIQNYLTGTKFSSSKLSFGSGPAGKLRAEQFAVLLSSMKPDDPFDNDKIVILCHAVLSAGGVELNKCILKEIADITPAEFLAPPDNHKTLEAGMNYIFGKDALRCAVQLVRSTLHTNDDDRRRIRQNLVLDVFDYSRCDDFIQAVCNHLLRKLLAKEYNHILSRFPAAKELYERYEKFLNGTITVEQLRKFMAQPPPDTYISRLPPDLRSYLSSHVLGVKLEDPDVKPKNPGVKKK